ncbi:MAG: class I SAM-dependent methyltransferase [Candidatus Omnitrophica bacterium]|nr:class I SAM-dependent methyltransferase [Candidatus Omnitrophota bacterium]
MTERDPVRDFYRDHPEMVSSPFGGVDYYLYEPLQKVWDELGFLSKPGHVLEIGCGRAWLRDYLNGKGSKYIGIDLVPSRKEGETLGPDLLGSSELLPFSAESFDSLICIDAYEHFPHPDHAAREFQRVLKPGGEVFISTPNYGNVAGLVKKWMESFGGYEKETWAPFGKWTPQAHEKPVSIRRVKKTFSDAGFTQGKVLGMAEEVYLGLFPWAAHPKCPEAILFRLQRGFPGLKRVLAKKIPGASLHQFWRWKK